MKEQRKPIITIPKEKWIEVYNSIIVLLYFRDEYNKNENTRSINAVNERLNDFCRANEIVGENFRFEGGANALSFCYLIIVRIHELVDKAAESDGNAKHALFRLALEQSKCKSFDDLKNKYKMTINTFPNNKQTDDAKLYRLFKHLRHSVSHFNYEIIVADHSIHFKSVDPKNKNVELDMSMPMAQLINLTADFGTWVNNTLHKECLLTADAAPGMGA